MSLSLGIGLGLSQQRIGGGGAVPEILEYRSHTHTVAASTDVTIPSGIDAPEEGDFIIAMATSDTTTSPVTPSGWTLIDSDNSLGSSNDVNIVAKISDGTETGSLQMFTNANDTGRGIVLVLKSGLSSLGSIVDAEADGTNGNPSAQVKNASTLGALPFVVFGYYASATPVDPRIFTGDTPDGEEGGTEAWVKWKFYGAGSSPADITIDMDDEGSINSLASAIIEVNF